MKQITVRGIPDEVEKIVQREAKTKGSSLNKAFISLLERATGIKAKEKKKTLYHDLDHFWGVWTKEDASIFNKNLHLQRKIDKDLWKKTE